MKKKDRSVKKALHTLFISALFFPSAWLYGVCDEAWVGDNNGNVVVISTETQTQTSIFPPGDATASGIAFTPDGTEVFLVDVNTGVYVIDAATQTDIPTPGTPISIVPGVDVAISLDGEFAYIPFGIPAEGPAGAVLKVNTTTLVQTILPTSIAAPIYEIVPSGIAVTPDGSRLYIVGEGSFSGQVLVVDSATGNTTFAMILITGFPFKVAITPNGSFAYVTVQAPGNVYQINTSALAIPPVAVSTVGFSPFVNPGWVVISPNGQFAYVTDSGNNSVYVIQISTNAVVNQIFNPSFNEPAGIAITPDGSSLYVANFGSSSPTSTVSIINTSTFAVTTVPTTNSNSAVITMAPACAPIPPFSGPVSGRVCKNKDFWQTEIFSAISWSAPLNFIPTEYQIFRNGVLIDTVSSSQLFFKQHDLKKNKTYVYSIFAVNSLNMTLFIGSVSLKT